MKIRIAPLLAAAAALVFTVSLASAQAGLKPIPKPSDRRPGELEGWTDGAKPQAKDAKSDRKSAAKGAKAGKTAKAAKPERTDDDKTPDGGIPLPNGRKDANDYAPVGFDRDGKLGTGMKF